MKKLTLMIAALALSLSASANTAKKPAKAEAFANLDVAASTATWVGKKVTESHTGKVAFKGGKFGYKNKKLANGEVVIDLNTITNEDVKNAEYNKKLVDHLKGEDFFDAAKHPEATLKITSFSEIHNITPGQPNLEVKGTLTLRGVTKPITTKAFFTPNENGFEANGKLVLDRTQYGLKYNSKKFFDVKKLGDKLIDDNFEVDFKLVAKK